jgi:putative transposase
LVRPFYGPRATRYERAGAADGADGAHGLWAAASAIFAETRQQRCWNHKIKNVLDKLPNKHHDDALAALREIMYAGQEQPARHRLEALAKSYERTYPKATACLRDDSDRMFAYYRFPKENHKNLRTTNPIESIFASVRLRTDAAKRLRTIRTATSMLFALIQRLAKRWRRVDGYDKLATIKLPQALAQHQAAWDNYSWRATPLLRFPADRAKL